MLFTYPASPALNALSPASHCHQSARDTGSAENIVASLPYFPADRHDEWGHRHLHSGMTSGTTVTCLPA